MDPSAHWGPDGLLVAAVTVDRRSRGTRPLDLLESDGQASIVDIDGVHNCALFGKSLRSCLSDSGCGASDDGDLASQPVHTGCYIQPPLLRAPRGLGYRQGGPPARPSPLRKTPRGV